MAAYWCDLLYQPWFRHAESCAVRSSRGISRSAAGRCGRLMRGSGDCCGCHHIHSCDGIEYHMMNMYGDYTHVWITHLWIAVPI